MISFALAWVLVTMAKEGREVEPEIFLATGVFDIFIVAVIAWGLVGVYG